MYKSLLYNNVRSGIIPPPSQHTIQTSLPPSPRDPGLDTNFPLPSPLPPIIAFHFFFLSLSYILQQVLFPPSLYPSLPPSQGGSREGLQLPSFMSVSVSLLVGLSFIRSVSQSNCLLCLFIRLCVYLFVWF